MKETSRSLPWPLKLLTALLPIAFLSLGALVVPLKVIALALLPGAAWLLSALVAAAMLWPASTLAIKVFPKAASSQFLASQWTAPVAFGLVAATLSLAFFSPSQSLIWQRLASQEGLNAQTALHPALREPAISDKLNILLVGLDAREGNIAPRPDSLTLIRFNPSDNSVATFPIYRDATESWLEPGTSLAEKHFGITDCAPYCRLSDLVARVNLESPKIGDNTIISPTSAVVAQVIAEEYELNQLAVVEIDLSWVENFVDNLGGIEIDVAQRIPIGGKWTPDGMVKIRDYIEPGMQRLSGEQLKWYVRARWGSSNENRVDRQLEVIAAILAQKSDWEIGWALAKTDGFRTTLTGEQLSSVFFSSAVGTPTLK